jgi:hypothetical protein
MNKNVKQFVEELYTFIISKFLTHNTNDKGREGKLTVGKFVMHYLNQTIMCLQQ